MNSNKLLHTSEPLREQIIDFHENELPEKWQPEIPNENLAVDGSGRPYSFSIEDTGFEEYQDIDYYVNRPVNEDYFLTIMANTKDNMTVVYVLLCEGSEIVGFNSASRGAKYHCIESESLEQVESEEELPEHFDDISRVVKRFAEKYQETGLDELQESAS